MQKPNQGLSLKYKKLINDGENVTENVSEVRSQWTSVSSGETWQQIKLKKTFTLIKFGNSASTLKLPQNCYIMNINSDFI